MEPEIPVVAVAQRLLQRPEIAEALLVDGDDLAVDERFLRADAGFRQRGKPMGPVLLGASQQPDLSIRDPA